MNNTTDGESKNVLNGNVDLNSRQFARLKREKKDVRALARKRTSLKKRQIVQKGGFIGALLMPPIATLGSLLVNRMEDGGDNEYTVVTVHLVHRMFSLNIPQ